MKLSALRHLIAIPSAVYTEQSLWNLNCSDVFSFGIRYAHPRELQFFAPLVKIKNNFDIFL